MIKTHARHPIITSVVLLAIIGIVDFHIACYSATPTATPTSPAGAASKSFGYDITVPLVYNGQNVGSTVIPKGNPVEVISETATTITIRHMGNTLTVNKPGATPTPAVKTPAEQPKVTAQPVNPVGKPATTHNAEYSRMGKIPERKLPYPIVRFVIETDGTYNFGGQTYGSTYSYERIGTKLRLLNRAGGLQVWEVDDANTFESIFKADPKLGELIIREAPKHGPNWAEEFIAEQTSEKTRILIVPNELAIPSNTPLKEVLELIAKRDPRMQSLVDAANNLKDTGLIDWSHAPNTYERVGIEAIAKELLESKSLTPAAVSLRDEVERLGVKHRRQIGGTCTVYSAYHLLDFNMKKGVIRPISFQDFYNKVVAIRKGDGQTGEPSLTPNNMLKLIRSIDPDIKIRVRQMTKYGIYQKSYSRFGCEQIYLAFIQHELEMGRPLWAGVEAHQVIFVGYDPDAKPITRVDGWKLRKGPQLTALDSTGYGDDDHNYSHWPTDVAGSVISFEFIKPATTPAPEVIAQPVKPAVDPAEQTKITRMLKIPERKMPYPVMAFTVESDGSYTCNFCTHDTEHFERIGTKLRVLATGTISSTPRIWELDYSDTIEAKMAADPKFAEGIKSYHKMLIATRGFGENYIDTLITNKTRVTVGPSIYAIPPDTPIKEVLALIAKHDPRMQSLIDACNEENAYTIQWRSAPTQCERVDIKAIAAELRDSKAATPATISLREEVERLKVTHRRQTANNCTVYSAYHLFDYYIKKGVLRPFTFAQFQTLAPPSHGANQGVGPHDLLKTLVATQPGLKIRVREMKCVAGAQRSISPSCANQLMCAFIQNEIACGRPLWVGVGGHQVMGVGFQPCNRGTDELIALDSTGFGDKDHGYSHWPINQICQILSLELIK